MRGRLRGVRLACGAAAPLLVAVLLLASPAHAAPSGQPASPSPTSPGVLPIHLPLSGIELPIHVPFDLSILTGADTASPSSAPSTAKVPPTHSGRPSSTGTTRPQPNPSAALGAAARTRRAQAVPAAATTSAPARHGRQHKHRRHPAKPRSIRAAAHRDGKVAADLVNSLPVHAPNVELLLGVIALFCLGVIAIVTVSGRRGRPERKHRR